MSDSIQDIANILGAKIVTQFPHVGGGAFGASRLAEFYRERMAELRSRTAQIPKNSTPLTTISVTLATETLRRLESVAQASQTTPAQVASDLVEYCCKAWENENGRKILKDALTTS